MSFDKYTAKKQERPKNLKNELFCVFNLDLWWHNKKQVLEYLWKPIINDTVRRNLWITVVGVHVTYMKLIGTKLRDTGMEY